MRIVLHHNDPDGIASGLVVKMATRDADTRAVNYGCPPPDISTYQEVVIVDFAFPAMTMMEMATTNPNTKFVVIDHHERVQVPELPNVQAYLVPGGTLPPSQKKAGIDLVLEKYPVDLTDDARTILRAIGRRDVWDFDTVPGTAEIAAAVYSYDQTIESYETLLRKSADELRKEGAAILRYQKQCVQASLRNAEQVSFNGKTVLALNTDFAVSETGNALAKSAKDTGIDPIGVTYVWDPLIKKYRVSLRSIDGVDVAHIAREFGGGGHVAAAGFTCEILPWK